MQQLLIVLIFFGVMYTIMVRPQQKKAKERKEMLEDMRPGDEVITVGGIYATIASVEGEKVVLEVAEGVNMTFTKNAIGNIFFKKIEEIEDAEEEFADYSEDEVVDLEKE